MAVEYSIEVCRKLEESFRRAGLSRPMRISRYDAGAEVTYDITDIEQANSAQVRLKVERFVGGGFAGQVYKVRILSIKAEDAPVESLKAGGIYAMKILIPPSGFSLFFRNMLYWLGFQGPFQLQVNPAAARAGAFWQKFIRQAAKIRFGDEKTVADIYATFVDRGLGSCGELSEWIDGRTWQLEVDDRMDLLKRWRKGGAVNAQQLGSAEYREKLLFMREFVRLLHEMGAYEFARQYEWTTCKSQPNCLKPIGGESEPTTGLTAVDFRAGLALLPFLPMSPGDFKLIIKGIMRGSLVQFDRGSLDKLKLFINKHSEGFGCMPRLDRMLGELKANEDIYRNSVPDITHNHIRLFYSRRLWATILGSAVTGWKTRNLIDQRWESKLRGNGLLAILFFVLGVVPFLGKFVRRLWARPDWREHYAKILTSPVYFKLAVRAKIAEKVILWHRAGRIKAGRSLAISESFGKFLVHLPFSLLPGRLHRFLTDFRYAKERLAYFIVRPVKLYFNAELREQWLRDMLAEGKKKHMLSEEDACVILSQINEPFIQKYLKSLAVHVCTLPVTQIVSVAVAAVYYFTHPDDPNAWVVGLGIIGLFQVIPVSPGSLVRGLYVVYLVASERNFKDYNIAVFLGFFKYVGYLAFPIQMTYHYPALARFMAGHWATEAVHIVPVFGERGALLEHWVFCLFYNWPLTIRRRMRKRAQLRALTPARYWHVPLCIVVAAGMFTGADLIYYHNFDQIPGLKNIWPVTVAVPLLCGVVVTLGCAGAALVRRIVSCSIAGVLTGLLYAAGTAVIARNNTIETGHMVSASLWRIFIFAILATAGAILTELKLPEPDLE